MRVAIEGKKHNNRLLYTEVAYFFTDGENLILKDEKHKEIAIFKIAEVTFFTWKEGC